MNESGYIKVFKKNRKTSIDYISQGEYGSTIQAWRFQNADKFWSNWFNRKRNRVKDWR